ncbi:MAG: hypothetical protein SGPRY_003346, partial [Prymnesium sp.]
METYGMEFALDEWETGKPIHLHFPFPLEFRSNMCDQRVVPHTLVGESPGLAQIADVLVVGLAGICISLAVLLVFVRCLQHGKAKMRSLPLSQIEDSEKKEEASGPFPCEEENGTDKSSDEEGCPDHSLAHDLRTMNVAQLINIIGEAGLMHFDCIERRELELRATEALAILERCPSDNPQ